MGTAFAMHSARAGLPTSLWANEHDLAAYAAMREERKHPLLPEHLPDGVELRGPNELEAAARDVEIAVLRRVVVMRHALALDRSHVKGFRDFIVLDHHLAVVEVHHVLSVSQERLLERDLHLVVEIVPCPTARHETCQR